MQKVYRCFLVFFTILVMGAEALLAQGTKDEMNSWPTNSTSGIPAGWTVTNWDAVDEQQDEVVAYPNPVVDKLHITGPDIQSVKVYDMQGRMVHSKEGGHADQMDLDFHGFAKGIYTVSIQSEGQKVTKSVVF